MTKGFTPHQHNQEVKDVARYLFRQGMKPDVIMNTLAALNAGDPTPLTNYELTATVNSGIRYEQARLEVQTSLTKFEKPKFALRSSIEIKSEAEDYGEDWLIEDWIPEASIVMIAAMPEQYKTWLSFEAAVVVSSGGKSSPFLGEFKGPDKPVPVIIIQQEDELKKMSNRFDYIRNGKLKDAEYPITIVGEGDDQIISYDSPYNAPLFFHTDRELSLDDDESMKLLEQRIKETGAKLVVIDPFYSLTTVDDYFAGAARKLGEFKRLRDKYRVTFVLAHHTTKNVELAKGGNIRKGIFGSNLLNGAMEAIWMITWDEEKKERLISRSGKGFSGNMPVMGFEHRHRTKRERLRILL